MSAYGLISSSLLLIGLFNIFLTLHTLKEYLRGNRIVLHLMLATFFAALYCLFGSLTYFLASIHADYHLTYKICWIGYLTIPGFFHLAYSMRGTPLKWHKALVNGLYAFWAVIMVLLVTTDLIDIAPTQIIPYGEIEGRFEVPVRAFAAVQMIWVIIEAIRTYKMSEGMKRLRTGYLLIGLSLYALGGTITASINQTLFGLQIDPALASYFSLGFTIPLGYSMTSQRLFNLRSVLTRLGITTLITATFGIAHYVLFTRFQGAFNPPTAFLLSASLLGLALFFSPMFTFVRQLSMQFVEPAAVQIQEFLSELSKFTTRASGVDELIRSSTKLVRDSLHCQSVSFFLNDGKNLLFRHHLSHSRDNLRMTGEQKILPLMDLGPTSTIMVREELYTHGNEQEAVRPLFRSFDTLTSPEVIVPLTLKDSLVGVISLGKKDNFGAYTRSDFVMLDTLRGQLALAVEGSRLMTAAVSDGLTGLYNQTYFKARLNSEISRSNRQKNSFSVLLFDIDHFKQINDTQGHLEGDHVLQKLGELMRQSFRAEDIMARYGGEEFAVILVDTDLDHLEATAERFRRIVETTKFSEHFQVTVSIGGCAFETGEPLQDLRAADLLSHADKCLYEAKRGGRNRTVIRFPLRANRIPA